MRRIPPLTALRAFEAAARHLSFKAAADELGLTPTAISHQVRLLEEMCERPLFRRWPRPIVLTAAGTKLFPIIRNGFDAFATALSEVKDGTIPQPLRVTTTNAFASRWLVPRLPLWRAAQPYIDLEIIGTDDVIDLHAGNADVAIRYARSPPEHAIFELCRDRYWPVCTPKLLATGKPVLRPADLAHYPLIHVFWPEWQIQPPTWQRWLDMARATNPEALLVDIMAGPLFREELHAIDALIAGQGIGIASDVLVARELAAGDLIKVLDLSLPGFGYYVAHMADHPRRQMIDAFVSWLRSFA